MVYENAGENEEESMKKKLILLFLAVVAVRASSLVWIPDEQAAGYTIYARQGTNIIAVAFSTNHGVDLSRLMRNAPPGKYELEVRAVRKVPWNQESGLRLTNELYWGYPSRVKGMKLTLENEWLYGTGIKR